MSHATYRLAAGLLGGAVLLGGCTVKKQETPSLTGPSELSTAISISVSPDVLFQDGASQSLVTITARDSNGQPLRNLPLRVEIAVDGVVTDFGSLSARSVVTDANGRATVSYTAPPAPAFSVDTGTVIQIVVTPLGTDFANATPRFANIRLTPPGVINPPTTGLTPRFSFTPPGPTDHQTVFFDASESTSTNATIVSYQWNFGDGGTASGITAQHDFEDAGTFIVTLTVTDSIGRVNKTSQSVTVNQGTAPTAVIITSPAAPIAGQTINFNGSTSKPAPGRTIRRWDWDFGDGSFAGGPLVTHAYAAPGAYTVVLTVTDDAGRVGTTTSTITVGSGNPTADFTFSPSAPRVGQQVIFDASASQAQGGRTIVSYSWSFGDGTGGSGQTFAKPGYATVGTFNVLLTVTDSAGRTNSVTKSITISP